MSSGNTSNTETTQDFQCCCSVIPAFYNINGKGVIQIISCILTVPTSLSATLGNLLVLISIWRTPSLHSPSNILLLGLAMSDLGVGLAVQPFFLVSKIAKIKRLASVFCSSTIVLYITGVWLCATSLLTVTAISLDMYIALYLHLRYKEIVTVKRVTAILVSIWMFSFACSMLYRWYNKIIEILLIFLILLCLVVTTSAYYKVFQIVRRHRNNIDMRAQATQVEDQEENPVNMAEHRKSLVNKFLVYCLLVVCYLPYFLVYAVVVTTGQLTVTKVSLLEVSTVIVHLNSTLNPLVYCWRFQQIRVAIIETTKKIFRINSHQ